MALANSRSININRSALYDIQGNYIQETYIQGNTYNGTSAPGEQGIYELFKASCPDAFHDSQVRSPPPRCLEGTRVDVLTEIYDWMSHSNGKILWISGPAGSGKSAIAQTLAEACANAAVFGGSFFFFRGAPGRDTAEHLIPSITYQLVTRMPDKRARIGEIIEADRSILHKPQRTQIWNLILPLFMRTPSDDPVALSSHSHTPPFFIIVDGLDECQGDYIQRDIVKWIGELANTTGIPLRFIIVSRPEPQIEEPFDRLAYAVRRISLSGLERTRQAEDDIGVYLRHGFDQIYRDHKLVTEEYWPTGDVIFTLVRNSGGAFIYASTVLKYVGDRDFHPVERLSEILHNSPGSTPFAELDLLYRRVLGAYKKTDLLLHVLAVMRYGELGPILNTAVIETLLQLREGTIMIVLRRMRSIIDVDSMTFYHKSFTDFLHDKERALEYFIDPQRGNAFMARIFLRYMSLHSEHYENIKYNDLFRYAEIRWDRNCRESGRWDEDSQLLAEISKALDSCQRPRRHPLTYVNNKLSCLQWFQVGDILPSASECNPLDIQFRLFEKYWSTHLEERGTIHIFTFYEKINFEVLLGSSFTFVRPGDLCARYHPQTGRSSTFTTDYWVSFILCETQTSFTDRNDMDLYHDIVDPLVKRLLFERRELGTLADHSMSVNLVDSHIEVVNRCLEIFLASYPLYQDEVNVYSYAQKYWTKHLLHVPPGNPDILNSLKIVDGAKLRHKFSVEDIQVVQTWLQVWGRYFKNTCAFMLRINVREQQSRIAI